MKKTLKKLTALFAALLMCGSPLLEFPDGSFRLDLSAWAAEETEHTEHSYDNGFCTSCQALQPAEQNAEATYEIGNAGQLFWFAAPGQRYPYRRNRTEYSSKRRIDGGYYGKQICSERGRLAQ